jgi:hypothetical protein
MFYNPETKQFLDRQELSLKFNTSIPASLEEFEGWYKVYYGTKPSGNEFQSLHESEIEIIDGHYTINYYLVDTSLDIVKHIKKRRLNESFDECYDSKDLHIMSSLGFEINANSVANTNIEGLIKVVTKKGLESVLFRDFNNKMHEVSLDDLETMQIDVIMNGQELYAKKWQAELAIDNATTIDELLEIEDNFRSII